MPKHDLIILVRILNMVVQALMEDEELNPETERLWALARIAELP